MRSTLCLELHALKPRIALEPDHIVLRRGRQALGQVAWADVRRVLVAHHGPGQDEPPFLVVDAGERLLVVPPTAPGSALLQRALAAVPCIAVWQAQCPRVPWRWRQRLGGLLPLRRTPALAVQKARPLPAWQLLGPLPAAVLGPGA